MTEKPVRTDIGWSEASCTFEASRRSMSGESWHTIEACATAHLHESSGEE